MVTIPINQLTSYFEQACALDGVTYSMTFRYNDRDDIWRLDLADVDENPLALGLSLVTGIPLLRALRTLPGLPPGELIVIDTAGTADPTFDSLGRRHSLLYATAADLAALGF